MNRSTWLSVVAPFALWASVASAQDWKDISRDESKLIFRGEEVGFTEPIRISRRVRWSGLSGVGSYEVIEENHQWRTNSSQAELLIAYHNHPGVVWKRDYVKLQDEITMWEYIKKQAKDFGSPAQVRSQVGNFDLVSFALADRPERSCLGFRTYTGGTGGETGQLAKYRVVGFFCSSDKAQASAANAEGLFSRIGIQGEYVPPRRAPLTAAAPSTTPPPVASASPSTSSQRVPLAVQWEGVDAPMAGELLLTGDGRSGRIEFKLARDNATCSGTWSLTEGSAGAATKGMWATACSNGYTATGTYESPGPGRGTGKGTDSSGKNVRLSFGS